MLRHHDFASNKLTALSGGIPWDAELFALSRDRSRLAGRHPLPRGGGAEAGFVPAANT